MCVCVCGGGVIVCSVFFSGGGMLVGLFVVVVSLYLFCVLLLFVFVVVLFVFLNKYSKLNFD